MLGNFRTKTDRILYLSRLFNKTYQIKNTSLDSLTSWLTYIYLLVIKSELK